MVPISDTVPTRTTPYVVRSLMGVLGIVAVLPPGVPASLALPLSLAVPPWWLPAVASVWVLWVLGGAVEDRLGHVRTAALYLVAGAAALAAQIALSPMYALPPAGAGGAVAGLLGAHIALFPRGRVLAAAFVPWRFELIEPPSLLAIGIWLLVQLFAGTDAFALLGGALTGLAAGRLLAKRERMQPDWWSELGRRG